MSSRAASGASRAACPASPSLWAALARARGATLRYNTAVSGIHIERGHAAGVDLATGERLPADVVVCNADVAALPAGLFGADARRAVPARKPAARSLSAVTFAFKARRSAFPLLHHNVFLRCGLQGRIRRYLRPGPPAGGSHRLRLCRGSRWRWLPTARGRAAVLHRQRPADGATLIGSIKRRSRRCGALMFRTPGSAAA